MDKICLTGIRGYGYVGALPEEQVLGQWFEVDVELGLELGQAGASDRLTDTLDYGQVVALVQTLIQTARFALLERLATAIAEAILAIPPTSEAIAVEQVRVALTKVTAPIPNFAGRVTVELIRHRGDRRLPQQT